MGWYLCAAQMLPIPLVNSNSSLVLLSPKAQDSNVHRQYGALGGDLPRSQRLVQEVIN